MGVTDQFKWATMLVAEQLHFAIGGEASDFRLALDRAGQRRFEHCVKLVAMWARPYHRGSAKYDRLMQLLALVTPEKSPQTKYRDPESAAAVAIHNALDAELGDILRREP